MSDPFRAPPGPQLAGETTLHNSVLIRSHEPAKAGSHSWIMLGGLAVVIVAGGAFWAYVQSHPEGPIVNHAVAAAPRTETPWSG
ncbi:MAG TPA: hypothetical protein VGG29_12550 [Caulobacteraceae bacterium]|jgi:hypothetical protein